VAQLAQEYTERRRKVLQDPFCFSEQQQQGTLAMSMGTAFLGFGLSFCRV
jgi:hypothetical protein